ncbi:MAG: DUF6751 family protein [Schaedlerella sp.]|nr:DUF6751 family protein [Schaedlerella sp.]
MITNADITLYNHKYNKETRLDSWQRTVIKGVWFYVDNKVAVGDKRLISADVYKIRIPEDAECEKVYLSEDEYMNKTDVSQYWTLREGDIVVRGICDIEIEKPADLKELHKRYCKITSWSDNCFGCSPHWRIGGE